jgi:hypothetical protein
MTGTISAVSGSCPQIQLTVSSYTINTNSSTTFSGTSCVGLLAGDKVDVTGTVQAGLQRHGEQYQEAVNQLKGKGQRAKGKGKCEGSPSALCPLPSALCPLPSALKKRVLPAWPL